MDFLGEFHFLRPWWFLLLIPIAGLLWFLVRTQIGNKSWEDVCDPQLLPYILVGKSHRRGNSLLYLLGLGALIAVLALAGPTAERQMQPASRDEAALVIVFDLSRSMDAVDIEPSRLIRARNKVRDIIRQRRGQQTAIVGYAADAFTVVPLTDDLQALEIYAGSLSSDLLPQQGSRPDLALEQAAALVRQAGLEWGDILLVSDYVEGNRSFAISKQLAGESYRVSVLGVGTASGAPIKLGSGDLLSHQNETVIAPFSAQALQEIASDGQGIYARFDAVGDSDVQALTTFFSSEPVIKEQEEEVLGESWQELGPWLVLLLLPLSAIGFRRGLLTVLLTGLLMSPQQELYAAEGWDSWWLNDAQQGVRAMEQGEHEKAEELLQDPRWKAINAYRNKDYKQARKFLGKPQTADDWYNAGNMMAQQGQLDKAVRSYKKALQLEPDMEDAKHNMQVVEQIISQVQQQQQQQSSGEEGDEEEGEEQEGQEGEQGEQDQQDGEQGEEGEEGEQGEQQDGQQGDSDSEGEQSQQGEQEGDQEGEEDSEGEDGKEGEQEGDNSDGEETAQQGDSDNEGETMSEKEQAMEQWLRRIKDTPSEILKRKFQYQQHKEKKNKQEGDKPW